MEAHQREQRVWKSFAARDTLLLVRNPDVEVATAFIDATIAREAEFIQNSGIYSQAEAVEDVKIWIERGCASVAVSTFVVVLFAY